MKIALLTENDRASRRTRTWIMEPGAAPRKVWDRKQDAAYDDPGSPVTRRECERRATSASDHPQQKETIASPEAMGEARAPQRRHETASMPGNIPFHFAARIDT